MDVKGFPMATRSAFAAALVAFALSGCAPNPNGMGVADFGWIDGNVVDAPTGQPIPGATVAVGNVVALTSSNGYFRLDNVPVGTQTLRISAIGWQSYSAAVTVSKNTQTPLGNVGLVSTLTH
jgi:hypothetical protein